MRLIFSLILAACLIGFCAPEEAEAQSNGGIILPTGAQYRILYQAFAGTVEVCLFPVDTSVTPPQKSGASITCTTDFVANGANINTLDFVVSLTANQPVALEARGEVDDGTGTLVDVFSPLSNWKELVAPPAAPRILD